MKILRSLILTLAVTAPLMATQSVQAQERTIKQMLEECFWGLLFEREDQRGLSVGLNVVSGALGSYAVTSGTLSADTFCASKRVASLMFITEKYATLMDETVQGRGENLTAALNLAGCDAGSHRAAIASLRSNMPGVIAASPDTTKPTVPGVTRFYDALTTSVAGSCAA